MRSSHSRLLHKEVTWLLLGKTLMLLVTTGRAPWISSLCGKNKELRDSTQESALNPLMLEGK